MLRRTIRTICDVSQTIMQLIKNILLVLLTALACYGIFSMYNSWTIKKSVDKVTSDILLQRAEKVFKLVAIEGNFSEIYNYENHIFADMWPFRKKALVQVNAKVSIGYDFEGITFKVDEENRTITMESILEPQILSIEHDVKSYDFENGLFNVINDRDITQMGIQAKEHIRQKAENSDLFDQAEAQKAELMDILGWMFQESEWKLNTEEERLLD